MPIAFPYRGHDLHELRCCSVGPSYEAAKYVWFQFEALLCKRCNHYASLIAQYDFTRKSYQDQEEGLHFVKHRWAGGLWLFPVALIYFMQVICIYPKSYPIFPTSTQLAVALGTQQLLVHALLSKEILDKYSFWSALLREELQNKI